MEVTAGFRSHHSALQGKHSARSHAVLLRAHLRHAVHHAAAEQCCCAGGRFERGNTMDTCVAVPEIADAALSPSDRAWSLVCAHLWLSAAGLSLGAPRAIPMCRLSAARDLL